MSGSTHAADMSKDGARIDMIRAAMQQALDAIEGSGCKADLMAAADALRAALAEQPVSNADKAGDNLQLTTAEMADAARVIEWATTKPRKPAVMAFTAGPERQAAYWIEWAESRAALAEQAQPVAWLVEDSRYGAGENRLVVCDKHKASAFPVYTTPPAPVAPPGWRMVPVEWTTEMRHAFIDAAMNTVTGRETAGWEAALAAAPEAPTPPAPQPLTELPPLPEPRMWYDHGTQRCRGMAPFEGGTNEEVTWSAAL